MPTLEIASGKLGISGHYHWQNYSSLLTVTCILHHTPFLYILLASPAVCPLQMLQALGFSQLPEEPAFSQRWVQGVPKGTALTHV